MQTTFVAIGALRVNSAYWVILRAFRHLLIFFSKSSFLKNSLRNTIKVTDSLDQDHARCFVGPDLGPNCLQRLSADDICRQGVNGSMSAVKEPKRNYISQFMYYKRT